MLVSKREVKILDFDIETRPLSYWIPDGRPTAEISAIASCWIGYPDSMQVTLLGVHESEYMLSKFIERYNEADIVTGHYIRMFDLPQINGAVLEFGLGKLEDKLTSDTKMDLVKKGDIPATQEYLAELFELEHPKIQMSQVKWRKANRLTPEGIRETFQRVSGDVRQHMELRAVLLEKGLLKGPKIWQP